jgi:hypothetical protein
MEKVLSIVSYVILAVAGGGLLKETSIRDCLQSTVPVQPRCTARLVYVPIRALTLVGVLRHVGTSDCCLVQRFVFARK